MDFFEKPERKTKVTAAKFIFSGLTLLMGILLLFSGISEHHRYQRIYPKAVTVKGVITDVDVIENDEGADDYKMYMTFSYKGKEYTIHYKTSVKRSTLKRIGETVSTQINPYKPAEKISSIKSDSSGMSTVGVVFLAISAVFLQINNRKSYVKTYGMRKEAVKHDILEKLYHRKLWLFLLITGIGWSILKWYMPDTISDIVMGIGICMIAAGVYLLHCRNKDLRAARNDEFQLKYTSIIRKEEDTDSDGDPVYYLIYINDLAEQKRRVSRKIYSSARIGEPITHVYLSTRLKPFISFYGMDYAEI